ncbi:MAG: ribulose-phosphate 3-epimerase [Armatimonadota bacterium]|nr:ribulose-phosphate 3-epimerase [Armatimonadota bacterium]MDW8025811.1 ribulose-phosphate 3-epimerase [Armatimonadota bacterium]
MSESVKVFASVMCANWCNLEGDIRELESAGIDGLHFDIMDGHFVPNLTMGFDIVRSLRQITQLPFDVHLMVEEPERYIDRFVQIGIQFISVHFESTPHVHRAIRQVKDAGVSAIVALNPATPPCVIDYLLEDADGVLVMTVNPGFSGQVAVSAAVRKIADVKERIEQLGSNAFIQVDGNVSFELAPIMIRNGARILVGGSSSVFVKGMSISESVRELRHVIMSAVRGVRV